jgi:hypothetical protein
MIHGKGRSDGHDFHVYYAFHTKQCFRKYYVKPHFSLYFLSSSNSETILVQGTDRTGHERRCYSLALGEMHSRR